MFDMARHVARPELLEGFRAALREHGWPGATMERIARHAGVSRVTLHRQGVTKDGLLAELVEAATERYREAMWPALTGEDPGGVRLEQALGALCAMAEAEMEVLIALRAQSDAVFHDPEDDEQLTRSVFTEPLERILRDGAADGTIRVLDAVEHATVLFNVVGWSYVHLRTGHGWSPERARRVTVDTALHGTLAG